MCDTTSVRSLYHPNVEDIELPAVLYALSDPIRLQIVHEIAKQGENNCGEYSMGLPKSSVSYHFKVLREAGITRTRLQGTQRFMSLRHDDLEARFPGLLDTVLRSAEARIQ